MAIFHTEVQNICHIFLPCHFFCTISLRPVPEGTIVLLSPWMSQEQHKATKQRGRRGEERLKKENSFSRVNHWVLSESFLQLGLLKSCLCLLLSVCVGSLCHFLWPLWVFWVLPAQKKDKQNPQTHKISDVAFGRTHKFPVISTGQKEIGAKHLKKKIENKEIAFF